MTGYSSQQISEENQGSSSNILPIAPIYQDGRTYSQTNYKLHTTLEGHVRSISAVKFSPCGKYLATASADKQIKVWTCEDMKNGKTLSSHRRGVNDICWSSSSEYIVSASDDTTVKIFSCTTGACLKTFKGHTNFVLTCSFNPQSSLIASGGYDDTIRVWDVKTGKCAMCIPAHSDTITAVSFNHNGSMLASSSLDGCIRMWDVSNGSCLKTLVDTDRAPISFVTFTPNGKYLLSSQLDSTIKMWDFAKNKPVKYYKGHINLNYCVYANMALAGEKSVISGSEDGNIYIWDIQTKNVTQVLSEHKTTVLTTDSHPTLNILASGGLEPDNAVRIWTYEK